MMRDMDEVAKCMWFLADTGWTVRDDGPTTMIGYSGNMPNVTQNYGFKPHVNLRAGKKLEVDDLFTAVVVAWLGGIVRSVFGRVKDLSDGGNDGRVTGKAVTLNGADVNESADKLLDELPPGALIVRLDVRETHGGFVWTIYWQDPDDGEA